MNKTKKYIRSAVVVLLIVIVFLLGFQVYNVVRLSRYDGASMTVVVGSAHAEGVTVEITNHTDEKIQVGNMSTVRLQKRVVGLWIPLWWDFTSGQTQESGPGCDAGATCKQEMLWRGGYGAQGAGHYRVLQKVWADHAPGGRTRKYVISAEFTIP